MYLLSYITLCLIWGSTWMFIKLGLNFFTPITFAAVRFMLTALLLLIVLIVSKKGAAFEKFFSWSAVIFGIFNGLTYALVFKGESNISSSLTAVLNAFMPFSSLLLASLIIGEKITLRKITGLLLGLLGISFLYWNDLKSTSPSMFWGCAMILFSTLTYSTGAVLAKKMTDRGSILQVVTLQMLTSGIILTVLALIIEPSPSVSISPLALISLFYLAIVGSAVAFLLYYYLLKNVEVSKLSYISMITPVLAVTFGVIFLKEEFKFEYLFTLLAVIGGLYVINSHSHNNA